jgi:ABC-type lipoprotein export system ATPase subunit
MTAFVVCKQLVKAYRVAQHEIVALRGIDFEMARGEMVAIMGPSGAGKSSLLNLLGGLDTPTAGQLIIDGQNLLELKGRQLAEYRLKRVGFLWQQTEQNLLFHRSALRNVTLPMMLANTPLRERRERARELLAAVGLGDAMGKHPAELSGGMQQRVAIAVALANQPPLLLADEPTGALDRENAVRVMELLDELRARFGLTILMTTHDADIASRADGVLTLRDGALGQDIAESDEDRLKLDDGGQLRLPEAVRGSLSAAHRIAVEIRPEGVLLRPEAEDDDSVDAILAEMLPQDAPPESRRRRWWPFRRRKRAREAAS